MGVFWRFHHQNTPIYSPNSGNSQRAEDIFKDVVMPAYLRGMAAANIGFGHWENQDLQRACEWIDKALMMRPGNSSYQQTRAVWGCTQ